LEGGAGPEADGEGVSVLPGLTEDKVIAAFISYGAPPTLVDNETMRATIDSLVETTTERLIPFMAPRWWNIGWDWTLTAYAYVHSQA